MQNRRYFLKQLGLLGAGLSTLGLMHGDLSAAVPLLHQPFKAIRVKGRVTARGKGIPNVVITDGLSVVQTDQQGYYSFISSNQRAYVYMSVPSGYSIPVQANGSAAFFKKLDTQKKEVSLPFELTPLENSDEKHHFLVLADTQIQNEYEANQLLTVAAPDVYQTVQTLGDPNTFGIGCGDLVFDQLHLLKDYNEAVLKTGVPFFQVIGNHDMDLDVRSDELTANTFNTHYGPTYYSFNRGEVHYVVLDDVFSLGKNKTYVGYITEEQLAWLEQDLKFVAPGSMVIVSVHIPLITGAVKRYPDRNQLGGTVSNREKLYELLSPFTAHIMSGHTHFNDNTVQGKVFEHNHGTVCGAWWSGPICYDGTPSGYGVYEVNGSSLSWRYKSTGLHQDHQFRTYSKGALPDQPDLRSVNVWNWDPNWKVHWYEDGIRKGEMQRIVAHDPLSVELHSGSELPALRKWVEPQLSDHMFFFKTDSAAKQVVVEVTDRFGNVFSEKLNS
jgi:hypothetical protein